MRAGSRNGESRPSAATTSRQLDRRPARDVHERARPVPLHRARRRGEHPQRRQRRADGRSAPRAGCAPRPSSRTARPHTGLAWSKCRNSGEAGLPNRPSETRMSKIGQAGSGSRSQRPASRQQPARTGGDRIGPAVERRMLHRRQRRAIDDRGGDALGGEPAGQRARRPARAHDADLGRIRLRSCWRRVGAAATASASLCG